MSYEKFEIKAALNAEFEVIPTKICLYAEGVVFAENGDIKYGGNTYVVSTVKLVDLPQKLQPLFIKNKFGITSPNKGDQHPTIQIDPNLVSLNSILLEQIQNIVDPEQKVKGGDKDFDMQSELKKANTICNIADKLISIADLSLKAEMLHKNGRLLK